MNTMPCTHMRTHTHVYAHTHTYPWHQPLVIPAENGKTISWSVLLLYVLGQYTIMWYHAGLYVITPRAGHMGHLQTEYCVFMVSWWCHSMEMLFALLALCEGNPPLDSPHKGPVMQSSGVFFDVSLNKLLNIQLSYQWFEISWCSCGKTVINYVFITSLYHLLFIGHIV